MLSFSNFGSNPHPAARKVRRAVEIATELLERLAHLLGLQEVALLGDVVLRAAEHPLHEPIDRRLQLRGRLFDALEGQDDRDFFNLRLGTWTFGVEISL